MFKTALTALAAVAALGSAHSATIFTESFEGDIGRSWYVYDSFNQFMTVEGSGIEIQRSGTVVNAYDGNQYVELDSHKGNGGDRNAATTNSAMAAFVGLQALKDHTLSFAYRPRTNNTLDNGIMVAIGNLAVDSQTGARIFTQSQQLLSVDGLRNQQNAWEIITASFVAGVGDNAILFAAFGDDNTLGGFIDFVNVDVDLSNVAETPLPGGAILLGSAIAFAARVRRRV